MADQVLADKTSEARIAELEEQLRIATERALRAEKERDKIILDVNPVVPHSVIGTIGQNDVPLNPPLGQCTTGLDKTPVYSESQYFHPSEGQPTQFTIPESAKVLVSEGNQTQPQFFFRHPTVIDFDGIKTGGQKRDRLSLLEERLRAIEGMDPFDHMGPVDMCMVPGITMPQNFEIPEFEKYTGIECPKTHLKIYCNKMSEVIHNEPLLIHLFRESLAKHALTWYMGLDRARIRTWRDLSDAFLKQYKFNTEVAPDRSDLQNLEKKDDESVKAYAQRWRELAARIYPPLNDKELVSTFVNTFKAPYYTYLISNPSSSFSDMVLVAERVEQGIKLGKITIPIPEVKETSPEKDEVSFVSPQFNYMHPFPPYYPYPSSLQYPLPPMYQPTLLPSPQYPISFPSYPSPPLQILQPVQTKSYNPQPDNRSNQDSQNYHRNKESLPPLPVPLKEIDVHAICSFFPSVLVRFTSKVLLTCPVLMHFRRSSPGETKRPKACISGGKPAVLEVPSLRRGQVTNSIVEPWSCAPIIQAWNRFEMIQRRVLVPKNPHVLEDLSGKREGERESI